MGADQAKSLFIKFIKKKLKMNALEVTVTSVKSIDAIRVR